MSELIMSWLNDEVQLSSKVNDFEKDFQILSLAKIEQCYLNMSIFFVIEEIGQEILTNLGRDRETMTKTRDRVNNIIFVW